LGLAALVGCASAGPARVPAAQEMPVAAGELLPKGPSVEPLPAGREGFLIVETPRLDAQGRTDFERAIALLREREYAQAVPLLEQVIARSPGVTAPYINLALAYRQLEQPEAAERQLKTALTLLPAHPVASHEYGLLLRQAGRFAEARTIYEQSLASFPGYLPVRRNLGILCDLYLNDLACALEQYQLYSEAMPRDEQVKIWVADLQARLQR
ncbi:MAG: tetratricopeptide repeat protein, partial [Desulfuromonadales bacterium]|nr:tetratricopeptide repeat protein [Desulfuromonadales bacterium]